jgi:hypothetical protein
MQKARELVASRSKWVMTFIICRKQNKINLRFWHMALKTGVNN